MGKKTLREVLGQNLGRLMEHGKVSQTAVGEKMGMAQSTVGRIRKSLHAPDVDTVEALAKALGVQAWQLFVPNLDPTNMPILKNASPEEEELYSRLREAAAILSRKSQ